MTISKETLDALGCHTENCIDTGQTLHLRCPAHPHATFQAVYDCEDAILSVICTLCAAIAIQFPHYGSPIVANVRVGYAP